MVMTDVGARCPDCAPRRKLPQFEVNAFWLARGAAAAAISAAAVGLLWGWAIPFAFGFFSIFVGLGVGYAVSEPVSLATDRKAGPALQIIAALGVALAYFVRNLVAVGELLPSGDFWGLVAAGVGVVVAVNRMRF